MQAYTYQQLGALKAQILAICEQVAADNPTAWREAHNGRWDDDSARYNDLCVQALRAAGIDAGRNGKRGGTSMSDDVLAFGLVAGQGGADDHSGRFAEMAIIDFIGGAGGPSPSIGWSDVSGASPGRYMDPQGLPRVDGGGEPVTPTPTPEPTPTPTPEPTPTPPATDLSAVKAQLASLLEVVQLTIMGQAHLAADVAALQTDLHRLIGEVVVAEHLDDIKRRLDAVAQQVGGLDTTCRVPGWMR